MSWNLDIKADKDIKEEDVQKVVDALPQELWSFWGQCFSSRQPWGWSCATDIYNPKGRRLTIHGAGFSRHLADEMAGHLMQGLHELGYKTRKGRISE